MCAYYRILVVVGVARRQSIAIPPITIPGVVATVTDFYSRHINIYCVRITVKRGKTTTMKKCVEN